MTQLVRFTVYAILDPETREPRYVGVTRKRPSERLRGHWSVRGRVSSSPVRKWLAGLQTPPPVRVLATCTAPADCAKGHVPSPLALSLERLWTRHLFMRFPLLNAHGCWGLGCPQRIKDLHNQAEVEAFRLLAERWLDPPTLAEALSKFEAELEAPDPQEFYTRPGSGYRIRLALQRMGDAARTLQRELTGKPAPFECLEGVHAATDGLRAA